MLEQREGDIYSQIILHLAMSIPTVSTRKWWVNPRSTHWRDVCVDDPELFTDSDFESTFRMSRTSFNILHRLLQLSIQKQNTHLRRPINSKTRLRVFLYHVYLGVPYRAICNQFAVGKSSVSKIVGEVAKAIVIVMGKRYIRMPEPAEAQRSIEHWRKVTKGIPGIVGCIDGSHIPITRPCVSGNGYYNRKGFYSLNIQGIYLAIRRALLILAVVDHRKRFIDLTVGWPGSVADGRVWANSALKANIENFLSPLSAIPIATVNETGETINELVPAFLLGDSAYPNNARIVTTFKNTDCARCSITKHLNQKLAGARYYVENAFGICKGRFRILNRPLECATEDITRAVTLVVAICILHNFLIDVRDETDIIPEPRSEEERFVTREDGDVIDEQDKDIIDIMTRDILLRHIRWIEEDKD